jgi:hypothetical protein
MAEKNNEEKKHEQTHDGSEKVRPESEKDFAGVERAKKSKYVPATELTDEWKAREDESPAP